MALIILAIGGLLALVGAYAIATGLPIIEIERGWSMVIAGAVLLSGGLVVAALGIVVRTIAGLRAVLPASAPRAADMHDEPVFTPTALATPAEPPAIVDGGVPSFAVAAPAAAVALAGGAGFSAAGLRAPILHDAPDTHSPEPEDPAPQTEPEPLGSEPADVPHHAPLDHEAPIEEQAALDVPGDGAPTRAWHEQAFSAFDLDAPREEPIPVHAPEPPPAVAPEVIAPHETTQELPPDEPPEPVAAHEPDPAPEPVAEAPSTAPETPPGNLSVIGRYDSDGTSYVMYSDGSIEAQSDSGVFRFGSMAELKAFIEG